ncbi:hypothetical protein PTET_b0019 [Pseudoalteromonas tetraodonis]|nr:hypothetical protein PTET_b0019 [Pseudoalteromonas tetraodonis]
MPWFWQATQKATPTQCMLGGRCLSLQMTLPTQSIIPCGSVRFNYFC